MAFPEKLKPYQGIIYFMAALIAANFFWKYTMTGEEGGNQVMFFGYDISAPFVFMASHIARVTYHIINMLGMNVSLLPENVLRYENQNTVWVAWGCTGLKQTFIFTVIMLAARGSWKDKLWFIPLGWVLVYIINLLRIVIITGVHKYHPEMFILLHEYILKYLFYILIFLIWVYWEEKISGKKPKEEAKKD